MSMLVSRGVLHLTVRSNLCEDRFCFAQDQRECYLFSEDSIDCVDIGDDIFFWVTPLFYQSGLRPDAEVYYAVCIHQKGKLLALKIIEDFH